MQADKKYVISVQEQALKMLLEHTRFLSKVSESVATRLIDSFYKKAKTLESNPNLNPWLDDPLIPSYKYRKLLFEKRYLIIYQVFEKTVSIDAVVDCRQNYGWLLDK